MTRNPVEDGSPTRVILAEDDAPLRRLLASVLAHDGYEILEARNGIELLAHIEQTLFARRERVDAFLIIADIHMPELTGLDVLAILRCARATTPVILITAFGDDETHAEARELGARAVFDKPFDIDALRTAVMETLPPG
jgi:DNA-binding response OmpR family regulator